MGFRLGYIRKAPRPRLYSGDVLVRQEALRHLSLPVNGAIAADAGAVAVHIDAKGAGRAAAIVGGAAHRHLPHPAICLRDRQTKRGEGRKLV